MPDLHSDPSPSILTSERFSADAVLNAVADGTQTLEVGARGIAIKRVQLALSDLGFRIALADGVYGPLTAAAVKTVQTGAGLFPSGSVNATTLAVLDGRIRRLDHPAAPAAEPGRLDCLRFVGDPVYRAIAEGTRTLARGERGEAVAKLQWTLAGLGFEVGIADGVLGAQTEAAVRAFQRSAAAPESGVLDGPTLLSLDDQVAARLAELLSQSPAPEEKPLRYRLVCDLVRYRIVVVARDGDQPVAQYLTSPGQDQFPTHGDHFVLQQTIVLGWWQPPAAAWAKNLHPVPPGADNPMGLCKLAFGQYGQYIHGIPRAEEADLGRPASHGCLRMSGANILALHQRYAGPGTDVRLLRDPAASQSLAASVTAAQVADQPLSAGREYTAAYLYGEIGFNERLSASGAIKTGGRGN